MEATDIYSEMMFIDQNTLSTDQKFMFMLLGRLEKLESENTELKIQLDSLFKKSTVPEYAKSFYDYLKKLLDKHREDEQCKLNTKLDSIVTCEYDVKMLKEIPQLKRHNLETILTYKLQHDFSIHKTMKLLESYHDEEPISQEVVEWVKRKVTE